MLQLHQSIFLHCILLHVTEVMALLLTIRCPDVAEMLMKCISYKKIMREKERERRD